jgi:Apea-like HEPN
MFEKLDSAIDRLCQNLSLLWRTDSFQPSLFYDSYQIRRRAQTISNDGADVLPITGRAIRGRPGAETNRPEKQPGIEEQTRRLIINSRSAPQSFHPQDLQELLANTGQAADDLESAINEIPGMSYRLHSALGFKTWSQQEWLQKKVDWDGGLMYFYSFSSVLAAQLTSLGFEPSTRKSFDQWVSARENTYAELLALNSLVHYEYEVRIFLNGPPVDSDEGFEIASLQIGNRPIVVSLGYATDELLTPLVEYDTTPGFDKINTVVRYSIRVPVDSGEEDYLIEYDNAASIAELVLDGLRLCRPDEDIGVLALEVLPLTTLTPSIRKTWANRFQAGLARFAPKRFDFAPASADPLKNEEIEILKKTVIASLSGECRAWRYRHAVGRFRNSIERYSPSDPERLLEYAIALEALYLSDNSKDRGELAYRLALRAARFLESLLEKRKETFAVVNKLYGFRSRIAHGEDISQMSKQKDKEDLELVLERAPSIVARSILLLLQNSRKLESEEARREFWKSVELG